MSYSTIKTKSENWGQSQCDWWGLIIPTRTPTFKPPSTEQYTTTHSDRELQYHYCVNWNGEWREKVGEKLRFNLQTLCYQFNTTALSPAPLWQRQVCGWDREKESLSLILFGEKKIFWHWIFKYVFLATNWFILQILFRILDCKDN